VEQQEAPRTMRIVAELRERIESGELVSGQRVPSTREITRQWGVAMATATRVLAELRREGLVHAIPGVGTVVSAIPPTAPAGHAPGSRTERPGPAAGSGPRSQHPRRGDPDQALSLERIVAAAVAVADEEGLAAVSMRRVASGLGAATMSLYRHVDDKEDLLARMMDAAFIGQQLPDTPLDDWRQRLTVAARLLWSLFRRHPWLARALSVTRPQPLAGVLPYTEWVLATLVEQGLDPATVMSTYITLFTYVRGTAVAIEAEAEAETQTGMNNEEWMDSQEHLLQEQVATGRFPTLERLVTVDYDFDLDQLFEFGLRRLLDGIATLIASVR
jgi:AcrR family transcriptional regulator